MVELLARRLSKVGRGVKGSERIRKYFRPLAHCTKRSSVVTLVLYKSVELIPQAFITYLPVTTAARLYHDKNMYL